MALSSRTAILARHASGFWTWDVGSTDGLRPGLGFSWGGGVWGGGGRLFSVATPAWVQGLETKGTVLCFMCVWSFHTESKMPAVINAKKHTQAKGDHEKKREGNTRIHGHQQVASACSTRPLPALTSNFGFGFRIYGSTKLT